MQLFTVVKYIGTDKKTDNLKYGDIGTIIEVYDNDAYEVEFSYKNGSTKSLLALHSNELIEWNK